MKSSEKTTRSAPSAAARARAARALAALPSTSPTVGLSWASVMMNWSVRSVMAIRCTSVAPSAIARSEHSHALGDGEQPEDAGHDQGDTDRRRAHVLDMLDLGIVIHGQ